ncbi:MAG: hypothetical protein ACK5LO_13340 [Leucobacter sp.]
MVRGFEGAVDLSGEIPFQYSSDLARSFTHITAGDAHLLALGSDGNTYAWGWNDFGQLGDGTITEYRSTPVRVQAPSSTE